MRRGSLLLLVRSELAEALRARWFVAYAAVFLVAGLLLTILGSGQVMVEGYRSALRGMAGLMHLVLLVVPVMALMPAVSSVTQDRDNGMLEYLLAQPVSAAGVFGGKWAGTAGALTLAVVLGFGPGGVGAVLRGVSPGLVILFMGFTLLLATSFVSLGLLFAVLVPGRGRATALGITAWLTLVVLGTLGFMAAFVRWGVPEWALLGWSIVNPVEAFRMALLVVLDPTAGLLGPVGNGLLSKVGSAGVVALAGASLAAWTALPALVGLLAFEARPHGERG